MTDPIAAALARSVREHVYRRAADTGAVPQPPEIAGHLGRPEREVRDALDRLAEERTLILVPNGTDIWAAPPFCAAPSAFRVEAAGRRYRALCVWDALGVLAALGEDGEVTTTCGDCGLPMRLAVRGGALREPMGVVHFAVPARRWWDNIGFT